MDMVQAMRVAVEAARLGSFGGAARELRLSAASVSRIIADLEADLGVRLFNRTTRQLNLTDAGQEFVHESSGMLEELENMRSMVRERHAVPQGELRVSCVAAFGNECLAPALPPFLRAYPQLSVSVDIGNRFVDLIEEHYDVAIRVGPLPDSSLMAQKIASQRILIVASPEFCLHHGMPNNIANLASLPSIAQISGEWGRVHRFRHIGQTIDLEVPRHFTMNSAAAVRNACLTGHGFTLLPDFMVAKDIAQGLLVRLLTDYEPAEQPIYAAYAERRYTPQKIRVFVDYLTEFFCS